jgi:hypothetical protein
LKQLETGLTGVRDAAIDLKPSKTVSVDKTV